MVRFGLITMSFAVMAVAFYEMSGGSDFDAEALRLSRVDVQELPASEGTSSSLASLDTADTEVTRIALNLTTVDAVTAPARSTPFEDANFVPAAAPAEPETQTSDIILPSLIPSATPDGEGILLASAGVVVQEVDLSGDSAAEVSNDVRSVTGSRVNVRGGPGTGFSVVNSLSRGAQVEVLEDPGDGWVMMRPVNGGPVGWMADFLLTDAG